MSAASVGSLSNKFTSILFLERKLYQVIIPFQSEDFSLKGELYILSTTATKRTINTVRQVPVYFPFHVSRPVFSVLLEYPTGLQRRFLCQRSLFLQCVEYSCTGPSSGWSLLDPRLDLSGMIPCHQSLPDSSCLQVRYLHHTNLTNKIFNKYPCQLRQFEPFLTFE